MSTKERIDNSIEDLIDNLIDEHNKSGMFGPSDERKADIVKQIAKLRASMEPTIVQQKS